MPTLLRNPFRKQDENLRPPLHPAESRSSRDGSVKSSEVSGDDKEPVEYKLSGKSRCPGHSPPLPPSPSARRRHADPTRPPPEISDNGAYLPPSPPLSATDSTRRSFWAASTTSSRTSTSTSHNHRALLHANSGDDQFSISRESFDSYRRSFDISARSPVRDSAPPRQSLDSRTFSPPLPRASAAAERRPPSSVTSSPAPPVKDRALDPAPHPSKAEHDVWEDVDIGPKPTPPQPREKKRGLFSRITEFGDGGSSSERPPSADGAGGKPSSGPVSATWHHFSSIGGRKRGQSGQGSELGALPIKREAGAVPKDGSGLKKAAAPNRDPKQGAEERRAAERRDEGAMAKTATAAPTLPREKGSAAPSAQQKLQATSGAPAPAPATTTTTTSQAAEVATAAGGKSDSAIHVPASQPRPRTEELQAMPGSDRPATKTEMKATPGSDKLAPTTGMQPTPGSDRPATKTEMQTTPGSEQRSKTEAKQTPAATATTTT